tara:strand:+ start:872 stop:1387 length:516 start_codon:yes stop_codon:yes gene_type:complete
MLNGLLQKKQGVIINVLEDKHCAFAQTENDEQVFIEPKFTTGLNLQVADQVEMVVISNSRFSTQWKAIKVDIINQNAEIPVQHEPVLTLQEEIMRFLTEEPDMCFSTKQIKEGLGLSIGQEDVRREAEKLHNANEICRAKVCGPNYKKQTTFNLYSKNIEAFIFDVEYEAQ